MLTAPPHKKRHTLTIPAKVDPASALNATTGGLTPAVTQPISSGGQTGAEAQRPADMAFLIQYIKNNLLVERHELFVDNDGKTVRPGILVLINDADWELEGETEYVLQDRDEISFISTLHGG